MPHLPAFTEGRGVLAGDQGFRKRPWTYPYKMDASSQSDGVRKMTESSRKVL